MRSPAIFAASLLGALLLLCAPAQSQSFQEHMSKFFNDLVGITPMETTCSSLPGAMEMIEESGRNNFPKQFAAHAMALFNANSTHHCKTIESGQELELHFETSYKDARGVTWHLYSTQSLGPITYVWRIASFPYA